MAISTYKTFLMYKATSSASAYTKLIDITEFPDLGAAPEMLETTTLSDKMKTYINGLEDVQGLSFKGNYTSADYEAVAALDGQTLEYAVWFGGTESAGVVTPDGSEGKFEFKGQASVYVNGAGTNAVQAMTITIAPSTAITKAE